MRRYRKGETFRPPTAAESAASADALEGFRRRPAQPQDMPGPGSDIVKTPLGGIPARVGATIYSAECFRCVETHEADEKTILETDELLPVYNLDTTAVAGGIYARTGLTLGGTLVIDRGGAGGSPHILFRVTAGTPFHGTPAIVCSSVVGTVLDIDCENAAGVEVGDEVIVWDPNNVYFNVPIGVLLNTIGAAVRMQTPDSVPAECLYNYPDDATCRWTAIELRCVEDIYGCA